MLDLNFAQKSDGGLATVMYGREQDCTFDTLKFTYCPILQQSLLQQTELTVQDKRSLIYNR